MVITSHGFLSFFFRELFVHQIVHLYILQGVFMFELRLKFLWKYKSGFLIEKNNPSSFFPSPFEPCNSQFKRVMLILRLLSCSENYGICISNFQIVYFWSISCLVSIIYFPLSLPFLLSNSLVCFFPFPFCFY